MPDLLRYLEGARVENERNVFIYPAHLVGDGAAIHERESIIEDDGIRDPN
jgi:hypothetical protein